MLEQDSGIGICLSQGHRQGACMALLDPLGATASESTPRVLVELGRAYPYAEAHVVPLPHCRTMAISSLTRGAAAETSQATSAPQDSPLTRSSPTPTGLWKKLGIVLSVLVPCASRVAAGDGDTGSLFVSWWISVLATVPAMGISSISVWR